MSWKPGKSPVAHGIQVPGTQTRQSDPAELATPAITMPNPLIKSRDIGIGGISLSSQIANTTSFWKPQLQFGGASTGITYQKNIGFVFNIGKLVYAFAQIELTSKGTATGTATIVGLPFVSINEPSLAGDLVNIMPIAYGNMVGVTTLMAAGIAGNSNVLQLLIIDNTTGGMQVMTDTNFTNTGQIGVPQIYIAQ